ncbi:S9 family peptidase [Brassicibacter mesophilus]|uniref:S9 family peptidase n=1 Tax=Brassicibacter mesophilus TaxID=745119 RepID=UPI003D1B0B7F
MESIKLDDFTRFKFLSSIRYSPNGRYACFSVHRMDVEENEYLSNLWVYDIAEDKYFQLTSLDHESNFLWMGDSEHIIFSTVRNPKDKKKKEEGEEFTQYYKISINGGEATPYFRVPLNVGAVKLVNDELLVFKSSYNIYNKDLNELSEEEKNDELKRRKEEKDYEVIDEIPFWGNGQGFTNKIRDRLYIYDISKNQLQAITDKYMDVEEFNISPYNKKIVFTASEYSNKMEIKNSVYIYDVDKDKVERITPDEVFNYGYVEYINDDTLIAMTSDMKNYGINENSKFYIIDLNARERKCITPDFTTSTWNSVGSDCRYGGSQNQKVDDNYLYFITTEGSSSYINRIDINGNIEKITTKGGAVDGFDVFSGNIILIGLRDMKLQEIYRFADNDEIQVTEFNGWVQKNRKIADIEHLTVETAPGVLVDGWVMKPVDYVKGKKYPAILDIHGGPKTVYGEVFFHEMQYWANEGYVVFFCNPRGSDGKGNDYSDIRGKYGTIDYEDIMKFTDAVLEKYSFIDADRVGVTGGSYGGFMTNWIIGHTDRFKAAVSQRSISNWISKFCTTDIGYYFVDDQNGGTPWENHDKLWWHSPLKYADKVKTPTLFIHSEEDYRCWLPEGIQMFTALKYYGVEARMCIFKGENHELSRSGKPKHRMRRLKEITDWFDKYLK